MKCNKCKTKESYKNPIEKCYRCGKFYCFDHLTAVIGITKVKSICDKCIKI